MRRVTTLNLLVWVIIIAVFSTAIVFRSSFGLVFSNNVYSDGYRDGYVIGCTEKRQGFGGYTYVGEIKVSFHGFGGSATDVDKPGRDPLGAWRANFFAPELMKQCLDIRGDQLVRFYYTEKDIQLNGATRYEITKIVVLPKVGELKESQNHIKSTQVGEK